MVLTKINGIAVASIKKINGIAIANCKKWNGVAFPAGYTPLGDANFNYSTGGGGSEAWAGTQLVLTNPNTNKTIFEIGTTTNNSGIVFAQCDMTWQTNSTGEAYAGMMLTSSSVSGYGYDEPYSAKITSRAAAGGKYRLYGGAATFNSYDLDTAITKGKSIKITFEVATNYIKYRYRDTGTTAWVQMGTTKTYNILNGGSIQIILRYDYISSWTSLGNSTFNNIYFGTIAADYSSQYPN